MGNANARGDNAAEDGVQTPEGFGWSRADGFRAEMSPGHGRIVREESAESFGDSPPQSPGKSPPPILFAPPEPVPPINGPSETHPTPDNPWTNASYGSVDHSQEQGVPALITWSFGGNEVAVKGSWDNWKSRKMLVKSGKDHVILLVLPCGIYQYKFIVDGEWKYIPDLPCTPDEMGGANNLLDVKDHVPESIASVAEFEAPSSPDLSYNQPFQLIMEDCGKEPPLLPPQLHLTAMGMQETVDPDMPSRPCHVFLNHLLIEKTSGSQPRGLGMTQRFGDKFVTLVLYQPVRR